MKDSYDAAIRVTWNIWEGSVAIRPCMSADHSSLLLSPWTCRRTVANVQWSWVLIELFLLLICCRPYAIWSGAFFCFSSAACLICANSDLEYAPPAQQLIQKSVKQSMNCGRVWRECFRSSHLEGFKQKGLYLAPPHLIVHSALRWINPDNKLSHICLFACILCKVSYKE